MAAGWNKPASSIAEKTVERLRTPEDGRKREAWDAFRDSTTRSCDVMKRAKTPGRKLAPKGFERAVMDVKELRGGVAEG
jgi:hypothetical protein